MDRKRAVWRIGVVTSCLALLWGCEKQPQTPPSPIPTAYSMAPPEEPMPMPLPASHEKCYGIAPSQHNRGGAKGPGTARLDKQTDAWIFVPHGKCADYGGSLTSRRDRRL